MATVYNEPSKRIIPARSNSYYKPIWVLAKEQNALGREVRRRISTRYYPVPLT